VLYNGNVENCLIMTNNQCTRFSAQDRIEQLLWGFR